MKKTLGQFYTTNYKYILQNINIPNNINIIIEPFAGEGALLNYINEQIIKDKLNIKSDNIIAYDIDPKKDTILQKDTLLNILDYTDKFIITNPPYLARNKSDNKDIYDKYNENDLYKCFIKQIINKDNITQGGILIIPLNFFSSIRKSDINLRKLFLKYYNIIHLNIFEEKVFNDTSYTICSFLFIKKKDILETYKNNNINTTIYPTNKNIIISFNNENNYIIGGDIYMLKNDNKYSITRLTKKNNTDFKTNILAKCIDDNIDSMINLSIIDDKYICKYIDNTPNLSARTYAIIVIEPQIILDDQLKLVQIFNEFLNDYRDKYNSLFLSNYRESKSIARKRISFDLVYDIIKHLLYLYF